MNGVPAGAPAWVNLIPLLMIGLVILRNSRARTLRIERLWISRSWRTPARKDSACPSLVAQTTIIPRGELVTATYSPSK